MSQSVMPGSAWCRSQPVERGFALVAVIVALGILFGLAVPFALSMGRGDAIAYEVADQKQVELSSAAVRDLLLERVSRTHATIDPSAAADDRSEFPAGLELPAAFTALRGEGATKQLLAGEVEDLQRRVNLTSATPLVLANLLGLSARLTADTPDDARKLEVDDAGAFPAQGWLLCDRELIRYGNRDGNAFTMLERGQHAERGYEPAKGHTLQAGALVLDFRCVLAVMHGFYYGASGRRDRLPVWRGVEDLTQLGEVGFGSFSVAELDILRAYATVDSVRESAADFGRAERVFEAVEVGGDPWQGRSLVVRDSEAIGAGSIVRVRTLDGQHQEYALVMAVRQTGDGVVNLPRPRGVLELLLPLSRSYAEMVTVVEPLLPHPINVNTAAGEVLGALVRHVRDGRAAGGHGASSGVAFGRAEARQIADELRSLRGDADLAGFADAGSHRGKDVRPFDGFEDLARRWFEPKLNDLDQRARLRLGFLYQVLQTGRGGDMGTAPLTFTSAPVVAYRAAALRARGSREAARLERSGLAITLPNRPLDLILATQVAAEECFRLDRQSPWYGTWPTNLGSFIPLTPASTPPPRSWANVLPLIAPDIGFGQARFASRDGAADGFRSAPAYTPMGFGSPGFFYAEESMWTSLDADGRDLDREGPYLLFNVGPRRGAPGSAPPAPPASGPRAHQQVFPFTALAGLVKRHATSFWFKLRDVREQMLFDLAADDPDRNRISLLVRGTDLVLEVIDEAGLDPDEAALQQVSTSPTRTAGTWRVPLASLRLQPEIWYHANLSADGNRPGQLSLLLDGVPRGEPELRTYLAQRLPPYQLPKAPPAAFWDDDAKYLEVFVEDTASFPPRGTLRIGLELFEYTSKSATSFVGKFANSTGGRTARMHLLEYFPQIPVDSNGRPTIDINTLTDNGRLDVATSPGHEIGTAVELYGYVVPVYRNSVVQVGSAQLASAIGPFAVARVANKNAKPIVVSGQAFSFQIGIGLLESDTDDLELGDPLPTDDYPPPAAGSSVADAFSTGGGYALLMQHYDQWSGGIGGNAVNIGGIELIRYSGRNGSKLTGIQRGVQLPRTTPGSSAVFDGQARRFVTHWNDAINAGPPSAEVPIKRLPQFLCYVVPISLPARGNLVDPAVLNRSEWLQLYAQNNEADTEWVRYDYLDASGHVVRSDWSHWFSAYQGLTLWTVQLVGVVSRFGGSLDDPNLVTQAVYPPVQQLGVGYIGYTDSVEVQFPQIQVARHRLAFRGDPFTGTSSHAHGQSSVVLPVHRVELDVGNYGAVSGRVGRDDRVALVGGSQAAGGQRPPVDWHTVNWVAREYIGDALRQQSQNTNSAARPPQPTEQIGTYPFQLVGFKAPVRQLFIGPDNRDFNLDVRLVDRLVKFPSGELPAAAPEDAAFGGTVHKDVAGCRGTIDDLVVVDRRAVPLLVDQPFDAQATELIVRGDLLVTPQGEVVSSSDLAAQYPSPGGLVAIDGEILAYQSRSAGKLQIAKDGRGLLGTEPRAHDEGAMMTFLDHVPAAILASGLGETSAQVVVQDLGALPQHGGTVLVGRNELLHYTWTIGRQLLEMPTWNDPEDQAKRGLGLFRGRYGTTPVSAQPGEAVIWFPFRYWDRWRARADDPELAYFQATWSLAPVWFTQLAWREEQVDPLVDVHCLVRIDSQATFADDPKATPGLLLLTDGQVDNRPNPLAWHGSRLEARFATIYRPGAFEAQTFLAQAWKQAPLVRQVVVEYEGESRVVDERVSAR